MPTETTIEKEAVVEMFIAVLQRDGARAVVVQLARRLGIVDDILWEIGRRRLCEWLGVDVTLDLRPAASRTDPEGDAVDETGGDGDNDPFDVGPRPVDEGRRTCERCGHRSVGEGICHGPDPTRKNTIPALGDTCGSWILIPTRKKRAVWVGKAKCPDCGSEVAYREGADQCRRLRAHRDAAGLKCERVVVIPCQGQ